MTISAFLLAFRKHFWLLFRYGVAGVCGIFVQTAALFTWVTVLGLEESYLLGAFVAFCLALVITFALQKFWTFRDLALHRAHTQFSLYTAVAFLNVVINLGLLAFAKWLAGLAGVDFFAGWYLVAQVTISLFASAISFLLNYFFTFKHARQATGEVLDSRAGLLS